MARPLRITVPNLAFHVLDRGNNRQVVWKNSVNSIFFLWRPTAGAGKTVHLVFEENIMLNNQQRAGLCWLNNPPPRLRPLQRPSNLQLNNQVNKIVNNSIVYLQ